MIDDPETQISLIARMSDVGDDDAWSEFVLVYQPLVHRFIQRHGLQYADAVEVTQEVLSRVARSIKTWDPNHQQGTFRGWLYRITRNQTIDFLRKRKSDVAKATGEEIGLSQIADPTESESKVFQAEYEKQLFHWAAQKLKPTFKATNWKAFWMSTIDGMSIEDVARELKIDCGIVYVARSRIMTRLSQLIRQRLNETQL